MVTIAATAGASSSAPLPEKSASATSACPEPLPKEESCLPVAGDHDSDIVGFKMAEYDGRAAEIEASAEIVEEALAVAHTVYTETCGKSSSSSTCATTESVKASSTAEGGMSACASEALSKPSCQAIVPSSALEDTSRSFSCVLNLDSMQAEHMSFMTDSLGPGLPSLEELLACTQAHDILGVDKDANIETIKRAYHKRARAFHPDKHGDDNRDIDRAFNQAFMLITRAYMTLSGGDADKERLQILNKMDLRKDRPVVGWALQQKYDERKRERLTRAEKALVEARKEVAAAQQVSLGGPLGTANY
jgi:hypothetical protein